MTDNVTPALLRADAETMRLWSNRYPLPTATIYGRAAAALERWAEALEQGERVCRWWKLGGHHCGAGAPGGQR